MADSSNGESRHERFIKWNPYAAKLTERYEEVDSDQASNEVLAQLAVAFEISQVRTEIHFAAKGRSK